jgi:hypothetical protein
MIAPATVCDTGINLVVGRGGAPGSGATLYLMNQKVDKEDRDLIRDRGSFVRGGAGMAEQPNSFTGEESANPYAAPTSELADPWHRDDSEELALRRAIRKDESYVKGLVITNFLYVLFFGAGAVSDISILILHLAGQASAPWILRPDRFAMLFFLACMPISAFGAALGFLRRKRWALRFELALAVWWFLMWTTEPIVRRNNPRPALEFIGLAFAHLTLAAPMLTAWRLRGSIVWEPECSDAIAATTDIWVWPKIPLMPTLIAVAFFVAAMLFIGLSARA